MWILGSMNVGAATNTADRISMHFSVIVIVPGNTAACVQRIPRRMAGVRVKISQRFLQPRGGRHQAGTNCLHEYILWSVSLVLVEAMALPFQSFTGLLQVYVPAPGCWSDNHAWDEGPTRSTGMCDCIRCSCREIWEAGRGLAWLWAGCQMTPATFKLRSQNSGRRLKKRCLTFIQKVPALSL